MIIALNSTGRLLLLSAIGYQRFERIEFPSNHQIFRLQLGDLII
jgi:hypothetical protein